MTDQETFKRGMSLLAGGVTLITTRGANGRRGITATAVNSLSLSPPSLVACVGRETGTAKTVVETGKFAVNLLAAGHRDLAMVFAGAAGVSGDDRFSHGEWSDHPSGPPLLAGAPAAFVCELVENIEHGTHHVFIGNVVDVVVGPNDEMPAVWAKSNFYGLREI